MEKSRYLTLVLRQKFISRWGLSEVLVNESVLEHGGMTALLAVFVTDEAKTLGKTIDANSVITYGFMHDQPEILCLDLPSPLKNSTPEMVSAYEVLEDQSIKRIRDSAPEFMQKSFVEALSPTPKYVKRLGKACDLYHAYLKACFEVSIGNDIEFEFIKNKQWIYVQALFLEFTELKNVHDKYFNLIMKNYAKSYQSKKYQEQFTLKPVFSEMEHAAMVCSLLFIINSHGFDTGDHHQLLRAALINNEFGTSFYNSVQLTSDERELIQSCNDYAQYLKLCRDVLRLPKNLRGGALDSLNEFKNSIVGSSVEISMIDSCFSDEVESFDKQIEQIGANANLLKSA